MKIKYIMEQTDDIEKEIAHINEIIEHGLLEELGEFIGGGSCGMVYKVLGKYNVKKYFKPKTPEDNQHLKDELILKDLQGSSLYPKIYFSKPGEYIIKEHIEGYTFDNICKAILNNETDFNLMEFYKNLTPQLQNLYDFTISKGYYPIDLENDNVVIRNNGTICIIDVGLFEKFELYKKDSKHYISKRQHYKKLKEVREHIGELSSTTLINLLILNQNEMTSKTNNNII